eukprot:403356627
MPRLEQICAKSKRGRKKRRTNDEIEEETEFSSSEMREIIKPSPYKRIKLSCMDTSTTIARGRKKMPFDSMLLNASDDNFVQNEMTMAENPETQFSCVKEAFAKKKKSSKPEKFKIQKTCDYQKFQANYPEYYVDKTLWIKEVVESKHRIQVYTRPRGMGKSMNLNMLYRYLDIKQNSSSIFSDQIIGESQNKNIQERYLNKHPVIYIRLPKILKSCKSLNSIEYDLENYFNKELKDQYIIQFKDELNFKQSTSTILQNLIDRLFQKYNQKVFILIDDYDFIFMQGLYNNFIKEAIEAYQQILPKSWNYNEKIAKIIVTGQYVLDIPGTLLQELDSSVVQILNPSSPTSFGFIQQETQNLIECKFGIESKLAQKAIKFFRGKVYSQEAIFNPQTIIGFIYDVKTNKLKFPKSYLHNYIKSFQKILKLPCMGEKELLDYLIDLFDEKIQIDYYSNLKLEQIHTSVVFTNMLIQSGYLTQDPEKEKIVIAGNEVKALFYKAYLKLLNLKENSQQTLQYFRIGDFKTKSKNYNLDFLETNLHHVEHRPEAYKHLVYALFLQDNLPNLQLVPFKIDDQEAVVVIDEETS